MYKRQGARSLYGKEIPLACAGIISKAGMIFFSIIIGISQGMQPIAGFNYGAKKYRRVMQAYQPVSYTHLRSPAGRQTGETPSPARSTGNAAAASFRT